MSKKSSIPIVFFNASVVLAGLNSPSGGSGKLLRLSKQKQIKAVISEIVLDEIIRNASKIKLSKTEVKKLIFNFFTHIISPPTEEFFNLYRNMVIDYGDIHLLVSAKEAKADFLVTLDKKHILILQKKIKEIKIVSPKQLLENLFFS